MPIQRPDSRIILDESITSDDIKDKSIKAKDLYLIDNLSFFFLNKSMSQNIYKNVWTKIIFDIKEKDINNNIKNNSLIIDEDSIWILNISVSFSNKTDIVRLAFFKNDVFFKEVITNTNNVIVGSLLFDFKQSDNIALYAYTTKDITIIPDNTFFNGVKVVW